MSDLEIRPKRRIFKRQLVTRRKDPGRLDMRHKVNKEWSARAQQEKQLALPF